METAEFVEMLRAEGVRLAALAERAGWQAPVPACPGWLTRDLVTHTGHVHRWAARYVGGAKEPVPLAVDIPAPDGNLADWFRAGHTALVEALSAAPPDLDAWTLWPAAAPHAFWARRQAHETAIHRVDAERAAGAAHIPFAAAFAADGVDELLRGVLSRPQKTPRSATPMSLLVRAADAGRSWLLRLSDEPLRVEEEDGSPVGCTVTGTADALYLALWNRTGFDAVDVAGDQAVVDRWPTLAAV